MRVFTVILGLFLSIAVASTAQPQNNSPCDLGTATRLEVNKAINSVFNSIGEARPIGDHLTQTAYTYKGLDVLVGPIIIGSSDVISRKYIVSANSPAVIASTGGTIRNSIIHTSGNCIQSGGYNLVLQNNQLACDVGVVEVGNGTRRNNKFVNNCHHGQMLKRGR